MKNIYNVFAAIAASTIVSLPAFATWTITSTGNPTVISDGVWTLNVYNGKTVCFNAYNQEADTAGGVIDLTSVPDMTITEVRDSGFSGNTNLTKIIIPNVTWIARKAFYNCTALQTVEISSSFATLEDNGDRQQFAGCSSLSTIYPAGSEPIVGTVVFPSTMTKMTERVFLSNCPCITNIVATGVTSIGWGAFAGCTSLKSVKVSPNLASLNSNSWKQNLFHNNTETMMGNFVDFYPSTMTSSFVTYSDVHGNGTFCYTGLTNYFDFSECSFTRLGESVFFKTSIAGATIPSTVTTIGNRAFNSISKSATFRFLGAPPTFEYNNNGQHSVFYQSQQNQIGYRHTIIVDAKTYPAWTNSAHFVSVADFGTNSIVSAAYSTSSSDYPGEDTLGVTTYGFEGNTGNAARYAWLVQYNDGEKFTITWVNGDTTTTTQVKEGDMPVPPDASKTATSKVAYSPTGWTPAIVPADGDATYTATFSATVLSPMTIRYVSSSNSVTDAKIDVSARVENYTASGTVDTAAISANGSAVAGAASLDVPAVTASIANPVRGRGYEWTLTATQTYEGQGGAVDSASIHGRTWARRSGSWFEEAEFTDGEFVPSSGSEHGMQLRLRLKLTLPSVLPRSLTNDVDAVVGITPYQENAGREPMWLAWNGEKWVRLYGAYPTGGSEVDVLGVVDFARREGGVASPAVAWYIDGVQMTTEDGDWEVDLAGGSELVRFAFAGDTEMVESFASDCDFANGFFLRLR